MGGYIGQSESLTLFDGSDDVIPSVGTVDQFDSSTKIANMASVQRALGNFAGASAYTTTSTISATDAGKIINASGTITLTLPLGADVITGCSFQINNNGTGTVTVQANTGNSLYGIGKTVTRTFILGSGDSVTIAYHGTNNWYGWGGLQLGASSGFGFSSGSSGYQRLPTGEIRQWGVITVTSSAAASGTITFPISFLSYTRYIFISPNQLNSGATFGQTPNANNRPLVGTAYTASTSSFIYDVRTTDGSSISTSGTLQLNWLAGGF